jgi:hypothetical protein
MHAALMATLPEIHELQRRLHRALQGDLPQALRRRRQPLALDRTLIPYHGEPLTDPREVYRGQAKKRCCCGTCGGGSIGRCCRIPAGVAARSI